MLASLGNGQMLRPDQFAALRPLQRDMELALLRPHPQDAGECAPLCPQERRVIGTLRRLSCLPSASVHVPEQAMWHLPTLLLSQPATQVQPELRALAARTLAAAEHHELRRALADASFNARVEDFVVEHLRCAGDDLHLVPTDAMISEKWIDGLPGYFFCAWDEATRPVAPPTAGPPNPVGWDPNNPLDDPEFRSQQLDPMAAPICFLFLKCTR